jgi:hypothetical protein
MKQDRFLIGILIGIGVLVVVALVLFFTRRTTVQYVADDTVEGVLHNYVLAVQKQDYEKAYSYLADKQDKPSYETFRRAFIQDYVTPGQSGVEILSSNVGNQEAIVNLSIVYVSTDPFSGGGYSNQGNALLVKQDGVWKIYQMPYNYWAYDWYQPTPDVPAPAKP